MQSGLGWEFFYQAEHVATCKKMGRLIMSAAQVYMLTSMIHLRRISINYACYPIRNLEDVCMLRW